MEYIKEKVPTAELLLQETWAYEIDSNHGGFMCYHRNRKEMYTLLGISLKENSYVPHMDFLPEMKADGSYLAVIKDCVDFY